MGSNNIADVVVVGAGNAALTAALAARKSGAKVIALEKAPRAARGGNGRYTGGLPRFAHEGMKTIRPLLADPAEADDASLHVEPYPQDDFYNDLMLVSEGLSDAELCEVTVNESLAAMHWLTELGVKWELCRRKAVPLDGRFVWTRGELAVGAVGGGAGLVEMLGDIAEASGIEMRYGTKMTAIAMNLQGHVSGVRVKGKEGFYEISAPAVVLASGGFEANALMRTQYLGPDWDVVKVRGSRYNTGEGLRMALDLGAKPVGQWSGAHASQIDAGAGDVEDGLAKVRYSYPLGIIVNSRGERFLDEGENFWSYTYAKIGRQILRQPGRIAYQIFDGKVLNLLEERYHSAVPAAADALEDLAEQLEIPPAALLETVRAFNRGVADGDFNPTVRDGKCTCGVQPPKSNWAQKIDTPPFKAYPVACGITFTYGGIKINREAQVLDTEDQPIPGLYAAGEIVGGLFYHNYPGGSGIMSGAVFGRIAGMNAAGEARNP